MKNPLPLLAFLACLSPLSVAAQNGGPPGYTFGMFPNMFGNNGNGYTVPQGYMNQGQSPFMTMPAPQYPFANPQFPSNTPSPFPANPMARPTPFWMQTPASPQRYITDIPTNVGPNTAPPSYTVFTAPGFTPGPTRWAPLPGRGPINMQPQRPANNWSLAPNGGQAAPAIPAIPPKWPTP